MGIPPIDPYPMPTADRLPANTAKWTLDPRRAVLLLHDLQHYFVRPFAPGASPGRELVANVARLRTACAASGIPVAYTAQPGGMNETERGLLKDFWGPGMDVVPADREIIDAVAPAAGDWRFTKWRYSAFFRSDLLERMRVDGRDQLLLCGVYGHVGVLMTAVEAFTNDIETFLAADAIADFTEEFHWMTIDYAARCCAVVDTTLRLLDRIGTPARAPEAVAP